MPVINNINISLSPKEIESMTETGGSGRHRMRILSRLSGILGQIDRDRLVNPAIAYDMVKVKANYKDRVELEDRTILHSPLLAQRLGHADRLACGVVTIGNTIGEVIADLFTAGRQLNAVLMEEIANILLYKTILAFRHAVDQDAVILGLAASGTLAPGDEGFAIVEQASVLSIADARTIGISLSRTGMMMPRHSVSSVIGIGQHMRKWDQVENCANCRARDRCRQRYTIAELSL